MLAALAFIALAASAVESDSSKVNEATACELFRAHSKFSQKSVSVHGRVRGGGVESLLLSDPSCPGDPLTLIISNDIARKADVAPLWRAVYRDGFIGTVGKDIQATITGTYSYASGRWPRGSITVESVTDFSYAKN